MIRRRMIGCKLILKQINLRKSNLNIHGIYFKQYVENERRKEEEYFQNLRNTLASENEDIWDDNNLNNNNNYDMDNNNNNNNDDDGELYSNNNTYNDNHSNEGEINNNKSYLEIYKEEQHKQEQDEMQKHLRIVREKYVYVVYNKKKMI